MTSTNKVTNPCVLDDMDQVLHCLQNHLQAICAVEFYTIPLYLTATYSFSIAAGNSDYTFTPANSCQAVGEKNLFWWMQQQAVSVAVQEMYHLQCASNIANAMGVHPKLDPAAFTWKGAVPHLPNVIVDGLNNLPNTLSALEAIEHPNPSGQFPPPNQQVEYDSISALYHATLTLLDIILAFDALLPFEPGPVISNPGTASQPAPDQIEYLTFKNRYKYNVVSCRNDIAHLANAVSFQGEGASLTKSFQQKFPNLAAVMSASSNADTTKIPEQYQPTSSSRFARWDCWSHYDRFVDLETSITSGQDYAKAAAALPAGRTVFNSAGAQDPDRPDWVPAAAIIQQCLNVVYSYTLDIINASMVTGGGLDNPNQEITFTQAMTSFKYLIPQIWQWGQIPNFTYVAGTTAAKVQTAMDAADPLCLYHWDAATLTLRKAHPDELNACQGLNSCSGRGWGALSTKAGDGACATLDIHTCVDGNSCKGQGACGFVASDNNDKPYPCDDLWVPGQNSCNGKGGCQVPIATKQRFSGTLPPGCNKQALAGTAVWDEARKLLGVKQHLSPPLPTPIVKNIPGGVDYDGDKRRAAISATST